MGPHSAAWAHMVSHVPICAHIGAYGRMCPYGAIWNHMGHMGHMPYRLYAAICSHMMSYAAICCHMLPYAAIMCHMGPCGAIWCYMGPAVWGPQESYEASENFMNPLELLLPYNRIQGPQ